MNFFPLGRIKGTKHTTPQLRTTNNGKISETNKLFKKH